MRPNLPQELQSSEIRFRTAVEERVLSVIQHVPGNGPLAGDYKGSDAVLSYYGKLAELTSGTFRAHLVDVHGDGHGHVTSMHVLTATRNGVTRVSRVSICRWATS